MIAEHVWNSPCSGAVTIAWGDPHAAFAPGDLPAFSLPKAWAYEDRCRVEFNADWERRFGFAWAEVCDTMIHEYGHLAGMDHSDNPNSIMAVDRVRTDPRCRGRGRAYLERRGLL